MMLCELANLARLRYLPPDPKRRGGCWGSLRKCVGDRRRHLGMETSQRTHQIPCLPRRSSRVLKLYVVVLRSYGKPEWLLKSHVL